MPNYHALRTICVQLLSFVRRGKSRLLWQLDCSVARQLPCKPKQISPWKRALKSLQRHTPKAFFVQRFRVEGLGSGYSFNLDGTNTYMWRGVMVWHISSTADTLIGFTSGLETQTGHSRLHHKFISPQPQIISLVLSREWGNGSPYSSPYIIPNNSPQ